MDQRFSRYPVPSRRDMLASLNVRVFRGSWTLAIRCACGRQRVASPPELATVHLGDCEERTLGKLVRRLTCQDCGQRRRRARVVQPAGGDANLIG